MVSFKKSQIWVHFGGPWNGECWSTLWPFGMLYNHLVFTMAVRCHLVRFVEIWYIFPCFGMLYHEKSGNLVVMAVCSNSRRNYLKNSRRWVRVPPGCAYGRFKQVCQIILGKTYQNGKNIPNHHKIHHIALKYTKGQYVKYFK
jgi:hypothetical protein